MRQRRSRQIPQAAILFLLLALAPRFSFADLGDAPTAVTTDDSGSSSGDGCTNSSPSDQDTADCINQLCQAKSVCDLVPNAATTINNASSACFDSSALQQAAQLAQGLMGALGAQQSCQQQNQAMNLAMAALSAFQGNCGSKQSAGKSTISGIDSQCKSRIRSKDSGNQSQTTADLATWSSAYKQAQTSCLKAASKWNQQTQAAQAGQNSLPQSQQNSAQCQQQTTAAPIDCTQPANAQAKTCVCAANPNDPNCATASTANTAPTNIAALNGGAMPDGGNGDPGIGAPMADASNPSGGVPGSGLGSGAGGAGGPLGVGGATPSAKGLAAVKDPNFGGGGAAGSGGGAGNGGRSGWSEGPLASATKKAAMLDRKPANQVSGKAGQSNWDKVNRAYLMLKLN